MTSVKIAEEKLNCLIRETKIELMFHWADVLGQNYLFESISIKTFNELEVIFHGEFDYSHGTLMT